MNDGPAMQARSRVTAPAEWMQEQLSRWWQRTYTKTYHKYPDKQPLSWYSTGWGNKQIVRILTFDERLMIFGGMEHAFCQWIQMFDKGSQQKDQSNRHNLFHKQKWYTVWPLERCYLCTFCVCDVRPQKAEVNRTWLTIGGNRIHFPVECGMPTADMLLVKILFNSVVSTCGAKFMCITIKNFFPQHALEEIQVFVNQTYQYYWGDYE